MSFQSGLLFYADFKVWIIVIRRFFHEKHSENLSDSEPEKGCTANDWCADTVHAWINSQCVCYHMVRQGFLG